MNTHLLIPFYRKHLLPTLLHFYEKQNIILHPICDEVDIEPFADIDLDWVQPFLCPPLNKGDQCYIKINYFIEAGNIIDEDYYTCCGDDDMFEDGFFDNLKTKTGDIVYSSGYRGDTTPRDGSVPHPTYPLIPRSAADIRPGNTGLGMFSVKGHILKQIRFGNTTGFDDGILAQKLLQFENIEYNPDWFIFGNYYQNGRYTTTAKFLKSTWTLPEYI